MRQNILLITGTDTGVGKTAVACLLVRALRERGVNCRVFKPVETGCETGEKGKLIAADAEKLQRANGEREPIEDVVLYRYASPVAPAVAAEVEGQPIDFRHICETLRTAAELADLVVCEGAGGLLVPITAQETFLDLARALEASTLVVVGSKLGAINHALLTFHAIRAEKISCLGYVFNEPFAESENLRTEYQADALSTNRKLLSRTAVPFAIKEVAMLPFLKPREESADRLARLAEHIIAEFRL